MNIKNGIICFTFDDRNFEGWLASIPLFEKYNAHASFFICGEIDGAALDAALQLYNAGHTIGLHTRNHFDAPEYFDKYGAEQYYKNEIRMQKEVLENAGIKVTSFAYPNNKRTDETDLYLSRYFNRFRAGNSQSPEKYIKMQDIADSRIMKGFGIGEYYNTVEEEVLEKLRFVARENVCMTFFSHNICDGARSIHMPRALLEKCLIEAYNEGIKVIGFDELP